MNENNLEATLKYLELGFSVLPVGKGDKGKAPLLDTWVEFQERRATKQEIQDWFTRWPNAEVAIVTGKISNLVVLDVEAGVPINTADFPPTVMSRTGSGGYHFYYKHPGVHVTGSIRIKDKVDIRGDGNYVLAPPSKHLISGNHYEWLIAPWDAPFEELPSWILEAQKSSESHVDQKNIFEGVEEGQRNDVATRLAGMLLSKIPNDLWDVAIWPTLKDWNTRNKPPLPEGELRSVYQSIASRELSKYAKEDKSEINPLSVADVLTMEVVAMPFLVESLIPERGISAVSGYPESGKSWALLHMALCIAQGKPVFGKFATKQGTVLFVDEEAGVGEFQRRMKILGYNKSDSVFLFSQEEFKVDDPKDLQKLLATAEKLQVKLVIFDPFSAIHGKTENSAEEMQRVMASLQQFNKIGASVIFIHHHRKENFQANSKASMSLRGSSVLFSRVDSHIAVKKDKEGEEGVTMSLEPAKLRRGLKLKPFQVTLKLEPGKPGGFEYVGEVKEDEVKKEEAKLIIAEILSAGVPKTTKELIPILKDQADIGKSNVEEALKDMKKDGHILSRTIHGRGRAEYHSLTDGTEEDNVLIS